MKQKVKYLQKENTTALRGILASMVLIHHIYLTWGGYFENQLVHFVLFSLFGYLPVSIFLFLSGYGLSVSYKEKGDSYVKSFLKRRIFPFYSQYVLLVIIYFVTSILTKENFSVTVLFTSLTVGGTIVKYGWYFQTQLILYLLFYIVFKSEIKKKLMFFSGVFMLLFLICALLKLGSSTWWITSPVFLMGMFWGTYQEKIDGYINKTIICIGFSFILTLLFWKIADIFPSYCGETVKTFTSALLLSFAVVCILKKVSCINRLTQYLGKLSFEIYGFQGIMIILAKSLRIYNPISYMVVIVLGTIALAQSFHPVMKRISKICDKF